MPIPNRPEDHAQLARAVADLDPAAFASLARATSQVDGVLKAIESQVERLLPEGIAKSARNRVVGEIYRELDSTLCSNRTLTQQMRDAFRFGTLDANHPKAIVT
jgi:hypothetical protein